MSDIEVLLRGHYGGVCCGHAVIFLLSCDGGSGDVFSDVSPQIETDWKLGLIGRNGRSQGISKKYQAESV